MGQSAKKKNKNLVTNLVGVFASWYRLHHGGVAALQQALFTGYCQQLPTGLRRSVRQALDLLERMAKENKLVSEYLLATFIDSVQTSESSPIGAINDRLMRNADDHSFFLEQSLGVEHVDCLQQKFDQVEVLSEGYGNCLQRIREALAQLMECCQRYLGEEIVLDGVYEPEPASPMVSVTTDDLVDELKPGFDAVAEVIDAMNRFVFYKMLICLCRVFHLSAWRHNLEQRCDRLRRERAKFLHAYKSDLNQKSSSPSQSLREFLCGGDATHATIFNASQKNRLIHSVKAVERRVKSDPVADSPPRPKRLSF